MMVSRRGGANVRTNRARGVPKTEQPPKLAPRNAPDWEGTRLFLETIRHGSFRSAAEALGLSLNAVRRRFDEFEKRCGMTLVTRDAYGVHPTPEGKRILRAAEQMEAAYFNVVRARDESDDSITGRVKLAVTEGLGTFWIAPRLIEFQRAFPKLLVEMHCAMAPADVLRLEADVGVQLVRPSNPDLKVVKIGKLHAMPFASRDYVKMYGLPKTVSEFGKSRIVLQISPQVDSKEAFDALFPGIPTDASVVFESNTSSAHYWSIAKGAGIGILPTYANAMGAPVMPIDIRYDDDPDRYVRLHYDIWLTYHPQGNRIARVHRLIDWVKEAFSPRLYPWFSDEFIHPNDLPASVGGRPLANLFAGFLANNVASDDEPAQVTAE
jgi:DNA-binding transcriptional LysR family regulator